MLDHVSIAVTDIPRAARFYDAVMAALGVPCVWREERAIGYGRRNGAACHWCFRAPSRAAVRAFHQAGLESGGIDDGARKHQ